MKRHIIGLALCLALLGAGSAQALVIDNFFTAQGPVAVNNSGTCTPPSCSVTQPPPDPAGSIASGGGTRILSLMGATGGIPPSTDVITGGPGPLGIFALGASASAVVTATVDWRVPAGMPVNLLDPSIPGAADDCPDLTNCFLIFGVEALDHPISITVTLTDSDGTVASNTYLKHDHPIPPPPVPALDCNPDPCPQIVGPIGGDVGATPAVFGNYFHGLSLFSGGGIDPATSVPFGGITVAGGVAGIDYTSISRVVFAVTTPGSALDFNIDCIYTAPRVSTGTETITHTSDGPPPAGALAAGTTFTQTYATFDPAGPDGDRFACPTSIPEPTSLLLMGLGLLGVGFAGLTTRRIRRRQQA